MRLFFLISEGERTLKRETKEIVMVNLVNLIRLTNLWGLVKCICEYLGGCVVRDTYLRNGLAYGLILFLF